MKKLRFSCREKQVPMHFYEAMQVFAHIFGMPEMVPGGIHPAFSDPEVSAVLEICEDGVTAARLLTGKDAAKAAREEDLLYRNHPEQTTETNLLKRRLYRILSGVYGYESPWGVMTGIRPTKIVHKLVLAGHSEEEIRNHFRDFYFVSQEKIDACLETYKNQERFLTVPQKEAPYVCGFYAGIPFCPSICSYCTFGSSPIARYRKTAADYVDRLCKEIRETAKLMSGKYVPESVYLGGGTPSVLDPEDLAKLLETLRSCFPVQNLKEFCVEAGRPDTITEEKLRIIREAGATRISINPQTMNEKTLRQVGRNHSPEGVKEAYFAARKLGFDNINMDIIAGLPGESVSDFRHTLEELEKLQPDGITCHTLALKRASNLSKDEEMRKYVDPFSTAEMVHFAYQSAKSMGLVPFYMYRQKNCVGNNENISYCRPGKESPYNIHIMEEDMDIIACGAGASTKIVTKDKIGRWFNPKHVEEYMGGEESVLERKREALCSK